MVGGVGQQETPDLRTDVEGLGQVSKRRRVFRRNDDGVGAVELPFVARKGAPVEDRATALGRPKVDDLSRQLSKEHPVVIGPDQDLGPVVEVQLRIGDLCAVVPHDGRRYGAVEVRTRCALRRHGRLSEQDVVDVDGDDGGQDGADHDQEDSEPDP